MLNCPIAPNHSRARTTRFRTLPDALPVLGRAVLPPTENASRASTASELIPGHDLIWSVGINQPGKSSPYLRRTQAVQPGLRLIAQRRPRSGSSSEVLPTCYPV